MKRTLLVLFVLALSACDNSPERADANMKKGDEYFASKDYEVAQYYYQKIPEESPRFKEAREKLLQIDELQKSGLPKAPGADEAGKVTIFEQTMTSNVGGTAPIHSVSLNNESTHRINSVELEFTYFDGTGTVVGVKRCKVHAAMAGKTQDTFTDVVPGVLDLPCTTSKARIVSVEFQGGD